MSLTKVGEAGLVANVSFLRERMHDAREDLVAMIRAAHQLQAELLRRGTAESLNEHRKLTQALHEAEEGWRR